MSDQSIIDQYISYVSSNRRKSSAEIYSWHLQKFTQYLLSCKTNLHESKITDIIQYIQSNKKWSATTTNHCVTILKMFYKWYSNKIPIGISSEELRQTLQRQREINEIIEYKLKRQSHKTENKALSLDETKMLLDEVKKQNELDYSILWIFFYFGIRRGEFLALNPTKHIIWSKNYVHLTGDITKNYTDRDIYFNIFTRERLIYILDNKGSRDRLFVCDDETYLNRIFSKYDYVLNRHIFPHAARHTFSTLMQMSIRGKLKVNEMFVIKTLMGHSSGDMTQRYTGIDLIQSEAKRAMLEFHYLSFNTD